MITRNALRAVALASSCLAPLAAFAQAPAPAGSQAPAIAIGGTPFSGEVGFGVMGVMGQNADQAGRYNGLNTTGVDVLGNFDLIGRDPWNSGGNPVLRLLRRQPGVPDRQQLRQRCWHGQRLRLQRQQWPVNEGRIGFGVGDQGTWGVNGFYQAITYTGNPIEFDLYGQRQPGLPEPWICGRSAGQRRKPPRQRGSLQHSCDHRSAVGGDRRLPARPDRHAARHRRR